MHQHLYDIGAIPGSRKLECSTAVQSPGIGVGGVDEQRLSHFSGYGVFLIFDGG